MPRTKSATKTSAAAGQITRPDAVRAALDAGKDRADDGVAFIRATFGVEISPTTFENYRAAIRSGRKRPGPKPAQKPAAAPASSPTPAARRPRRAAARVPAPRVPAARGRLSVDDVRRLLELCAAHGADTVRRLVTLLAD
jgi:hypothetical protein